MENTYLSATKPESADALSVVPVFASTTPAAAGLRGAELLHEHLRFEVVAHRVHPVHDRLERRRISLGERLRRVVGDAVLRSPGHSDAGVDERRPEELRRCERGIARRGAAD